MRMTLTGTREMNTNPVRTVPAIAPIVPSPESCPTTVPVCARVSRRILVTIGVTADSRAPGTRIASAATSSSVGGAHSAAIRIPAGVNATTAPDTPRDNPR